MMAIPAITASWECPEFAGLRGRITREEYRNLPTTFAVLHEGVDALTPSPDNPLGLPVFAVVFEGRVVQKLWWLK